MTPSKMLEKQFKQNNDCLAHRSPRFNPGRHTAGMGARTCDRHSRDGGCTKLFSATRLEATLENMRSHLKREGERKNKIKKGKGGKEWATEKRIEG